MGAAMRTAWGMIGVMLASPLVFAGEVKIEKANFAGIEGADWEIQVTLKHTDTGWQHYADAWRIVDEKGSVLGTRTLHHPHVDEQPFTRSLSGVAIPNGVTVVFVEAHDKVHGWSKDRVKVDLQQQSGDRYSVSR